MENKTKEQGKVTGLAKRVAKASLGLALVSGIFSGSSCSIPLAYVHKTSNSGGICPALIVEIDRGVTYNGAIISLYTQNYGTINGVNLSLVEGGMGSRGGSLNGISIKLVGVEEKVNGINIGVVQQARKFNGLGFALGDSSGSGYNLRVGGLLMNDSGDREYSALLNYQTLNSGGSK